MLKRSAIAQLCFLPKFLSHNERYKILNSGANGRTNHCVTYP